MCNNLGDILLQNDRSLIATANRLVSAAKDFNFEVVKNILCGNKSTGGKKIKKRSIRLCLIPARCGGVGLGFKLEVF